MTWQKVVGVVFLTVAGIATLPLYVYVASEPPDPARPDPAWLGPAQLVWVAMLVLGAVLAAFGERRGRMAARLEGDRPGRADR